MASANVTLNNEWQFLRLVHHVVFCCFVGNNNNVGSAKAKQVMVRPIFHANHDFHVSFCNLLICPPAGSNFSSFLCEDYG